MPTQMIPLTQITRNEHQPRETFPPEHIERLAKSIKRHGLIQPITVRPLAPSRYEIVAGECRYRAHQMLGRATIRAEVVRIDTGEMQLRAIVENLQRQDMNPMEEARSFQALVDTGMTPQQVADELGFTGRERVQNRLNLLALAPEIQRLVETSALTTSMASAIALAPLEHQSRIVREIDAGKLRTVDQVRHAGQALRDAAAQLDAFGALPVASPRDVQTVSRLEGKIDQVAAMVAAGFSEGECVAAQRVSPDRVKTMADKLSLIRKHVLDMEHQLRRVATQSELSLTLA